MAAQRGTEISIRTPRERLVASVRVKCHPSQLRRTIASAQDQVLDVIGAEGLAPAGPVFTRYHRIGPIADLEVGVPLVQTIRPHPDVHNSTLPGGPAVHAVCLGTRARLVQTVRALHEHLSSSGLTASGGYWEYYQTEPLPGLDLCQVEFYLPIVGASPNGKQPPGQKDPVIIEIRPESGVRPEPGAKSVFARRGPRWEEGATDIEVAGPAEPQEAGTASTSTSTGGGHAHGEPDASDPEA